MLRKSLFLGLTLMLGAILVWLVINGRKEEVRQVAVPSEIVKTARLSPTRIVAPADLEVSESPTQGPPKTGALGAVAIRNRGKVAYHNVLLQIACLANDGKILDTRTRLVVESVPPGQSITLADVALDNIPKGTIRFGLSIVYCDLGAATPAVGVEG